MSTEQSPTNGKSLDEVPDDHVPDTSSDQSPKPRTQGRRMSLNDLVHSLSPPPNPSNQLDDIPEKHLPHLTSSEKLKIDQLSRAIYDIQREQSERAIMNNEFARNPPFTSIVSQNPFKTFEQLSAEEQQRWKTAKERGGFGTKGGDGTEEGELRFGMIRNDEGDEVYGVWNLASTSKLRLHNDENQQTDDKDDGLEQEDKRNEVLERLNEFAHSRPSIIFTSKASSAQPLDMTPTDPPQYASRPPTPPQVEADDK
ncbi:hypothetical protein I203_101523 [Kwoniella mangroviensis CBS 8507]|uniref:uncharacterized protein n=1 Tax=Kwoniella mangroviensis CBS 8507 TaxID=1296122 RepID=UPI00080D253B|nr:uncharacterized protein I203_05575 [Kwoniella mangroviensis CBS 8507]OCF65328.1 hypothetical protein I203_05575 [Kwoniella mangroviensis CBS 8507]